MSESGPVIAAGATTPAPPSSPLLTANERTALQAIYDRFRSDLEWPKLRTLRSEFRNAFQFEDVCKELGRRLVVVGNVHDLAAVCVLQTRALPFVAGSEDDQQHFATVVRALADFYINEADDKVTGQRIAELAHLDHNAMRRISAFLQQEPYLWSGLAASANTGIIELTISHELFRLEHIQTFEDYVAFLDEREQAERDRLAALSSQAAIGSVRSERGKSDGGRRLALRREVETLKHMLIATATGAHADTRNYGDLRDALLAAPELEERLPDFVHSCRTTGEFFAFAKTSIDGGYQARREYLREAFDPALSALESSVAIHDDLVSAGVHNVATVQALWAKALRRRETDPNGAITASRSLLESVCKHVLDDAGVAYERTADLPKLYTLTARHLELAPGTQANDALRRVLGGCQNIVEGLGALRNQLGDAHGTGANAQQADVRHAELAVSVAGAMALFLMRTADATTAG
jgi:Abortive infection C-terminus